jgi:cytochrome c oxidase subunit 2
VRARGAPLLLLVAGCSGAQSALDVRGPAAQQIADLWWLLFTMAAVVYLIVMGLLFYALFRRRRGEHARVGEGSEAGATRSVTIGTVLTTIVVTGIFILTLRVLGAIELHTAPRDLTVVVTGRQWWWELEYQGLGATPAVVTANEIHIPVGRRVRLELTSADVIHSLWVPNLHGKTDLNPGDTLVTWLHADRPGVSRGQCAEYCGVQHALMSLVVVAQPEEDFRRWLEGESQPAAAPATPLAQQGRALFASAQCAYCHTVRGAYTAARSLGPDLTHIASRRMLAAASLENTRQNMARWITGAQRIKPGSRMPDIQLSAQELEALLAYLDGLR